MQFFCLIKNQDFFWLKLNFFPPPFSGNNEGQSSSSQRSHAHGGHSHRRPPPTSKNLILRPTKGPLLNAPKNSTQFIIDDHETSPLLEPIHQQQGGGAGALPAAIEVHQQPQQPKKYNTRSRQASRSSSRQVSTCSVGPPDERMELVRSPDKESASNDCQATPGM